MQIEAKRNVNEQTSSRRQQAAPVAVVAVLATLVAFGPMSIDMYLPSLPAIGRSLGASVGHVQLTLSAFFIGFSLGQLVYGPLSDRYGRRPVLLAGIALYIVTSGLCAQSQSIDQLVAFRFLHALGGGAGTVVARAAVRDLFDMDSASRVLSIMMAVMAIAPMLAPVVGGQLLIFFGWRSIFVTLTGFGILCWLLVAFVLRETNPPERRRGGGLVRSFAGYGRILTDAKAMSCIACGGFAFAGMFAYISGTPFVYIELFDVSPQHYGYLFGLNIIGLVIGALLNARFVKRKGVVYMMTAGATCTALAGCVLLAAAAFQIGGLIGLVVPLFFFIGALNMIGANAISIASADFPDNAGAVAALFGASQFGLGAVAGSMVGQLYNNTAIPMAAIIAISGLAALAANHAVRRIMAGAKAN
jgi:DHA1 family bicyclomycin/chloramphenicol resistance-like MFS transporter